MLQSQCVNRGIEKGSFASLKVFRQTESTARGGGWGVCTIQPILKGSFVCEYVGEILPGSLAYHRTDDSYLFELETKGDILEVRKCFYSFKIVLNIIFNMYSICRKM